MEDSSRTSSTDAIIYGSFSYHRMRQAVVFSLLDVTLIGLSCSHFPIISVVGSLCYRLWTHKVA